MAAVPDLSIVPTCELQRELAKREGVKTVAAGLHCRVRVLVNDQVADERRGPLTVTVNWD